MEYLICIGFTIALYIRTLSYGYVVDDLQQYVLCQTYYKDTHYLMTDPLRRIWKVIYGAGLFKRAYSDHLFTLALTATITCLIYALFNNIWIALLWCAHPMHNQINIWLNGRRYQVSIILGLVSCLLPALGFVTYPLAVFFHPISIPFIFIATVFKSPLCLLWVIPALLNYKWIKKWIVSRFNIQNFKEYKEFKVEKIVLAVKCIGQYILSFLIPKGFTMYHPTLWGISQLKGNKYRAYKINLDFFISLGVILLTLALPIFVDRSLIVGAFLAILALSQWSNLIITPVQIWAQRYSGVANIMFLWTLINMIDYLPTFYSAPVKCILLTAYVVITLKDMPMYRDVYSFMEYHTTLQPFNQNAHWYAMKSYDNNEQLYLSEKNNDMALINAMNSMATGMKWTIRNNNNDFIGQYLEQKVNHFLGRKK